MTQSFLQQKRGYEKSVRSRNVGGFDIPDYDHLTLTYVGSTNNISTAVYRTDGASGTIVGTLTFAYVGGTPVDDDARISTITRS
jgi:hypothetical protein